MDVHAGRTLQCHPACGLSGEPVMKINGLLILWILIFTWGCADEDEESLIILVPNIDLGVTQTQGDGFIAGDGDIIAVDQSVL